MRTPKTLSFSEEDDLSCHAMSEEVYGYENDVLEEVEYSESSQSICPLEYTHALL